MQLLSYWIILFSLDCRISSQVFEVNCPYITGVCSIGGHESTCLTGSISEHTTSRTVLRGPCKAIAAAANSAASASMPVAAKEAQDKLQSSGICVEVDETRQKRGFTSEKWCCNSIIQLRC